MPTALFVETVPDIVGRRWSSLQSNTLGSWSLCVGELLQEGQLDVFLQ